MTNGKSVDYITVDEYLDSLNKSLAAFNARVIGEVTDIQPYPDRSYLFFKIKDEGNSAVLTCFMWKRDYTISGLKLEVGMKIIVSGAPGIHKPLGRFSFNTQAVELAGEGQLKKAYDQLRAKLEKEGFFSDVRKRPLPQLAQKIGLITSKDGAVIGDFQVNLGRFGYHITFVDSRVEGQLAVAELLNAIKMLRKKDIEVLVIVRGGGSLESLLAFNNEALVREVVNFPAPVIVGVGHERDIPLIALAADKMVSTPTAAAHALNESWQKAVTLVQLDKQRIFSMFGRAITESKTMVDGSFQKMQGHLQAIFDGFARAERGILQAMWSLRSRISEMRQSFVAFDRLLMSNNPERQLKFGYSIVRPGNTIVKKIGQLHQGQSVTVQLGDGSFASDVTEIINEV